MVGGPRGEVDTLDLADVDAEVAMDAGAANAQEKAKVPGCPSRALIETKGGGLLTLMKRS